MTGASNSVATQPRFGDIVRDHEGDCLVVDPGPPCLVLKAGTRGGMFTVYTTETDGADAAYTPADPARLHRAARQIFRHLGERQGVPIGPDDHALIALAEQLALLADGNAQ